MVRLACIVERAPGLAQLASASGVDLKRIRKFLRSDADARSPSLAEFLSILAVVRAARATACLARIGLRAEEDDADDDTLGEVIAEGLDAMSDLAGFAARDGIGQGESRDAEAAADRLIDAGVAARALARAQGRRVRS